MLTHQSFPSFMAFSAQARVSLCLSGMLRTPERQTFLACAHRLTTAMAVPAADSRVLIHVDLITTITLANLEARLADF